MKKNLARILATFFASALIGAGINSCSTGACSATSSALNDFDNDCVIDTSDNCVIDGNPGGSYNPEQFDGDDDTVGVPCDADDADSGVALVKDLEDTSKKIHISGSYLLYSDCGLGSREVTLQRRDDAYEVLFSGKTESLKIDDTLSAGPVVVLTSESGWRVDYDTFANLLAFYGEGCESVLKKTETWLEAK